MGVARGAGCDRDVEGGLLSLGVEDVGGGGLEEGFEDGDVVVGGGEEEHCR